MTACVGLFQLHPFSSASSAGALPGSSAAVVMLGKPNYLAGWVRPYGRHAWSLWCTDQSDFPRTNTPPPICYGLFVSSICKISPGIQLLERNETVQLLEMSTFFLFLKA